MLLSVIGTHGYIKDTPEPLVINSIQRETIICVLNAFCFLYKNQPYNTFYKNSDVHTADERCYIYLNFQLYYLIEIDNVRMDILQRCALIYRTTHSGML